MRVIPYGLVGTSTHNVSDTNIHSVGRICAILAVLSVGCTQEDLDAAVEVWAMWVPLPMQALI